MSQGTTLYPATYYPGCSTTMEYLLYEFVSCSTIVACVTTMSLPVDRVLSVSFLYHVISSVDLPLARAWSAKWDAVLFVLTGPIFGYHVTTNKLPKYIRCDIHPEVSFIVYCALIPTIVSILDGCQQPSPWTTTSATRSWLPTCTSYPSSWSTANISSYSCVHDSSYACLHATFDFNNSSCPSSSHH